MTRKRFDEAEQERIDEGWRLFNAAMEAVEEAEGFIHDLADELDIDTDRTCDALGTAHSALDEVYSHGSPILPPHSSNKG